MSPSPPSLWTRYARDLRSGSLPVLLTAVPIALAVGLGVMTVLHEFEAGFLLLILIGVLVPTVHEQYWSRDLGWERDIAWTVGASAVGLVLFGAGYRLAAAVLDRPSAVAVVAFGFATVAGGLGLWVGRRRD